MKRKLNEDDVPDANIDSHAQSDQSSFGAFGLDSRLLQALAQEDFTVPTLVQAKAIPLALEGKDILARAKTGSGKTIAYLLPVLQSILRRKADDPAIRGISAIILVPTRELAQQVSQVVTRLCAYCARVIRSVNLTQKVSDAVQRSQLADSPDIIIATPARIAQNLNRSELVLDELSHFIIDEADLVLSYGYEEDLQLLAKAVPKGVQMMLLSATLSTDIETLKGLFCRDPVALELDEIEDQNGGMKQYVVKCAEEEKFLLLYVIFKLKLIKGKCIIFVSEIDRCYRLKLFLEQFGIRSCVLNSELPVNSRIHVVQEFNKNVYEIIIATDEHEVMGKRVKSVKPKRISDEDTQVAPAGEDDPTVGSRSPQKPGSTGEDNLPEQGAEEDEPLEQTRKRRRGAGKAKEYGISRGIDFKNVACVLNFDLPTSSKSYTHRIGRTARAGNSGTALSFVIPTALYRKHKSTTVPSAEHDEAILAQIIKQQHQRGQEVQPYNFDMDQVSAFRYRMTDALGAVTRIAVREARTRELRQELLNSEKLKRYFEENPAELHHLRHDGEFHTVRVQPHLRHVPEYLMPVNQTRTGAGTGTDMGFIPLRKTTDNRIRRARMNHRGKGRGKRGGGGAGGEARKGGNPLKTFKIEDRR